MKFLLLNCFILINISFLSCLGNKTNTMHQSTNSDSSSILNFGADPTGNKDNTAIFQKAFNSKRKVFIPTGTYRLDGMVEVKASVHIEAGTSIIRKKNTSNKTTPMFWLNKSYATIIGEDKSVKIMTENTSPNGVIKIGHKDASVNKQNINFCELRNLFIRGSGRENLKGNTGVLLYNSQGNGSGKASYFHTLNNIIVQQANTGIHLKGLSNANSISNILFNRVGKSNSDYALIIEGAMENRIYDVFHHSSKNANTILIKDHIHGVSKQVSTPVFNDIFGVISEPGGAKSRCLVTKSGKFNKVRIGCNCKAGFKLHADFYKQRNGYNTNKGREKK